MDNLFERERARPGIELNIVPIMDMLICVIFFLLLSTTFMGYTNLQLPPSSVTTVTTGTAPEPVSPKVLAYIRDNRLHVRLEWRGAKPGSRTAAVDPQELSGRAVQVEEKTRQLIAQFKTLYPNENTVQLSLSRELPYQILIALMDGVRTQLPDIVLFSYDEIEARTQE